MTQDDITEAYLRANVGFTRATNSLVFASPLDTARLPGVFQTLAVLTTGVSTLQCATDYYNFELSNPGSTKELSTQEWAEVTSGKRVGAFPLPLSLIEMQARVKGQELPRHHAKITGKPTPYEEIDQLRTTRLRLILFDNRRVKRSTWTPDIIAISQRKA